MSRLTFIIGGARSGKSDQAQRLAKVSGRRVLYVATAQPLDEEMQARIAAHQQGRPAQWATLELPTGVGRHLLSHPPAQEVVLLDCLTLLVSNLLLQHSGDEAQPDQPAARSAVEDEIESLIQTIDRSPARWIVVSNEVGQGLVPAYPTGRLFRDLLGWANRRFAEVADEVIWMVAGIPVPIAQHRVKGGDT